MRNKNEINMEKSNYPQFISNLPCGDDYTEGKAQERLSKAIATHIESSDDKNLKISIPRIIGLKGEWGIGKSNVIKQLRKSINSKYYIFEYDTWGHQVDLQRRSFLETLTTDLIKEKILSGDTTIENKKGETNNISWNEKLKYLLSTKREFETETRPKLNDSFILFILVAIFTQICAIIANINCISEIWWLSILITILPLIIAFFKLLCIKNKRSLTWKNIFHEIVSIYSGKIQNDVSYETISEEEPSVADFKNWMEDISTHIGASDKKLIVVYDNMDRLPADKVKELWSSIHTFFAENGFQNIWVIISFDEKHLSCAFGESSEKEKLTNQFISKTFPVVYRVTPPVITDYQKLFDDLYLRAFGNYEEKDKEMIYRILRLEKPNATIREMIEFLNSLVALKQIWKDEIDLLYCAVFKLKEKEIIGNPIVEYSEGDFRGETHILTKNVTIEEEILSGYYLGQYIKNILPNDETLQTNLAALVYGVPKNLAEQIPLIKYIESCFEKEENDINKYSKLKKFVAILHETIQNTDEAKTDKVIKGLSKLNIESFNETDKIIVANIWKELAKRKEKHALYKQEFDDSYKTLLLHVDDKNRFVKKLCNRLQNIEKEYSKVEFNGEDYYNALKGIHDYVLENNIDVDISRFIIEKYIDAETFVKYVRTAKNDYKTFKLYTNNDDLNDCFIDNDVNNIGDLCVLSYIKNDEQYSFISLKQKIEAFISKPELNEKNFKQIFDAYKLISDDKPLNVQLSPNKRGQIWNILSSKNEIDTSEYLEIVAMLLANNINVVEKLTEKQIKYIAEQIDYYGNYGNLLVIANNPNLYKVLKYMTENQLGEALSLQTILPQFFNIKNKIGVTENTFLTQLDNWNEYKSNITQENIVNIIPLDLYKFTRETLNDLTKHINTVAIEALSNLDENILYNELNNPNSYWYKVADSLIDTVFCKSLPNNVSNIGIRHLKEVATNNIVPADNSVRAKIIARLDKRKTSGCVEDIRDKFCNSQCAITVQNFKYLESWLRKQGELKHRPKEVVHRIIDPIINDYECFMLMVGNQKFYVELLNSAGEDITSTKQKIQAIIDGNNVDDRVLEFGKLIGITKEDDMEQK